MPPEILHLCGLAAAVFITTSVVVAAVRWFHMCQPYGRNPRYYYPGRPFVVGIYLNALALIPYALHPESADAWYLARFYFLPVTLLHFILLLYSYFGRVMQLKKWHRPMLYGSLPVAFALLAVLAVAIWPGDQIGEAAHYALYALGLLLSGLCLVAMGQVFRLAKRINEDDFSNPADFPVEQARRWLLLIGINILLCWSGVLSASRGVLAVVMLLLAASAVIFIITALHPNRTRPMEETEEAAEEGSCPSRQLYQRSLSGQKRSEILTAVRTVVEEQQAFLDPHLTLQDVADRSGYNRSYVAGLVKSELGGFFTYVNRLRLQHVEAYLQKNPSATIQEAAEESGFISRKAYYSVKEKMSAVVRGA